MKEAETNEPESNHEEEANPKPHVFAIKRGASVWSKREFLKTAASGIVTAAVIGCSPKNADNASAFPSKDPNNAIPPFVVGGTTYRLIDLKDYNGTLPPTGVNLGVVGYVQADFYFRYFNEQGRQAVNQHESKVGDKAALSGMKSLATSLAARGNAQPTEQSQFAELFSAIKLDTEKSATSSGRRMQGSNARVEARGRRMQGSAASGAISGRRMQGAEGRVEAGSPQRNLGTLTINGQRYENSRIVESYTDGYTRLAHADGVAVVRTDALPEVVQMQLPHPVANPSRRPTTVPKTTTVVPSAPIRPVEPVRPVEPSRSAEPVRPVEPSRPAEPVRPVEPSRPSEGTYTSHYWRPN
ncbi:MAG TPA: hypothetical protein VHA33_24320 [Candidatus Angelobacter sp.]|jgi:hypothetical protein|nr:hypothetical protein [Candidatus Angelobacter sp.]